MTSTPPRAAIWLIELFVPVPGAEHVLGDLEEEFAGRLTRSGHQGARRWYWREAFRTTVHLIWGAMRTAPWSTYSIFIWEPIFGSVGSRAESC